MRFDELCAGRAMGDLTSGEERELMTLAKELGLDPDLAYELLAASLEIEALGNSIEAPPASLVARLHHCAEEISRTEKIVSPPSSIWRKVISSPLTGWAVAAAVAVIAALGFQKETAVSPGEAAADLRSKAGDLIERNFAGVGNFQTAGGKIIWSDSLQKGYMTLTGIPMNNPKQSQYQLWIVDPKRDEAPVDGGVFDIPTNGSPVIVPISAKLALKNPQAFVITLEQPGGVVKSKQEHVVALAKN